MGESEDRTSQSDDVDLDAEFEELDDIVIEEEDEQPNDVIKRLRDKLKECTTQKQEYLDGWQRTKADMINTKKEFTKERERIKARTTEEVVADMLPVLDSFEMAFSNQEVWNSIDKQWRSGVEQIHAQLTNALKSHGVETIIPEVGDDFDPQLHTSVDTEFIDDVSKVDTVAACEKTGYRIGDRVIRSANVVVYKETA